MSEERKEETTTSPIKESANELDANAKEREFIPKPDAKTKKRNSFFNNWGSTIATVIICLGIVIGGRMVHAVRVVGLSMYPTYSDGAILFTRINDISTTDDITYNDIVVCSLSDRGDSIKNSDKKLIKRVVGMPGDTLQVIDGRLYRNDKLVNEDFPLIEDAGVLTNKLKLKGNEYFVMGDNRNNSYDCRAFGPIKEDEITNVIRFKLF